MYLLVGSITHGWRPSFDTLLDNVLDNVLVLPSTFPITFIFFKVFPVAFLNKLLFPGVGGRAGPG